MYFEEVFCGAFLVSRPCVFTTFVNIYFVFLLQVFTEIFRKAQSSCFHMFIINNMSLKKIWLNLFATRPVAATGFQTTAAYYTLRGDGLRGSQTYDA